MGAEPFPREPFGGTTDVSGNLTLPFRAPTQFYLLCYIVIAASAGTPSYTVTLSGASGALVYGQGAKTQLGPILLQPGERLSIITLGATPGATVAGQVLGWQAIQPEDLLPLLPLQPTAITITQSPITTVSQLAQSSLIAQSVPTVGVLASFTVGFDPPAIAVIDTLILTLTQVSGVASTVGVSVKVNNAEWGPFSMGVPAAAGSTDRLVLTRLGWKSPSNNATLVVAFSIALGGIQEAAYAYGWQQ